MCSSGQNKICPAVSGRSFFFFHRNQQDFHTACFHERRRVGRRTDRLERHAEGDQPEKGEQGSDGLPSSNSFAVPLMPAPGGVAFCSRPHECQGRPSRQGKGFIRAEIISVRRKGRQASHGQIGASSVCQSCGRHTGKVKQAACVRAASGARAT